MCKLTSVLFIVILLTMLINISRGFYIKREDATKSKDITIDSSTLEQSRGMFNRAKQQIHAKPKSVTTAMDKFLNMLNESKRTKVAKSGAKKEQKDKKKVHNLFDSLLSLAKSELKLNSMKSLKRSRRRVSVQLATDIPSNKIDELLKLFIDENEINTTDGETEDQDYDNDNANSNNNNNDKDDNDTNNNNDDDDEDNYSDFDMLAPAVKNRDSDYAYDNFNQWEQDMTAPRSFKGNSEYGSIQDLILQATKSQWQRDNEDNYNANERFN